LTGLDEIVFLPVTDDLTNINLYRSGDADSIYNIPPAYLPVLKKMRDHQTTPLFDVYFIVCNTRQAPLDNVLVRYALNMATEKRQVAKLFNGNQTPARTLGVPALGYLPPTSVPVTIGERTFDVSSYDPAAAREILAMAGFPGGFEKKGQRLRLGYTYTSSYPIAENLVELLRRQWLDNLRVELVVSKLDSAQFYGAVNSGQFKGLAQTDSVSSPEPATFLDFFFSSEQAGGTFWNPDAFTRLAEDAKGTVDRATRLKKVAECDRMVMEGMPIIPLIDNSWDYMSKPYVKGLPLNAIYDFRFKYAWVGTN
jgi:oligopeptide transport system substrate-binding protein